MKQIAMMATMFMILASVAFVTGCLTRATAYTKTTHKDGSVTESVVSVFGTGDKASEIAAEGLFADGTAEDLGAGVKNAKASQQSTGIDGTLTGLGTLMSGMANFMATAQGVKTSAAAAPAAASSTQSAPSTPSTSPPAAACADGNCATPAAATCAGGKCSTP